MRRKLLLSHLATAVIVIALVRFISAWMLTPELQTLPGGAAEARKIVDDFTIVLLFSGLTLALVTFLLFDTLVFRRVKSLGRQLSSMAEAADASKRVVADGDQDMARIAKPVNELLGSLQTAQAELAERQHQLFTSEQRLSLALEATGDGLFDYHGEQRTYCSETYSALLGYPPGGDQMQPDNWVQLIHPDDLPAVQATMLAVRNAETDLMAVELRMKTGTGGWKWVFLRGRVITRLPEGPPLRMIGTVQDIDARRNAEREQRENQELFRNAFEESAIGMAMVRLDGSMIRVNSQFCAITGYTAAELVTRTFQDITHPEDLQADLDLLNTLLSGERHHYAMEKRYIRSDGSIVWVLLNVGVVRDSNQSPLYLISQVQDITPRKQNEHELQAFARRLMETRDQLEHRTVELAAKSAEAEAAQRVAEQANRAKGAFLANMSHEIRTPMAAIIGFANLMIDQKLPAAEQARCVETIARQGQHLLSLINDVLDLSKIEAESMTVERIACDPTQVLADVEAMTAGRAQAKELPLTFHIDEDVPKNVSADPTRLRQVLLNLVSNAIKFTPAGAVRVELAKATLPNGKDGLRFVITDTGIGMSAEELDRLFVPFSQADVSTTRRFGGTGLGLAISKRLVEMMDGQIAVQSEPGRGTRFEVLVEAPLCEAVATRPAATNTVPALRPGLRVLLAEDGPDNRRLITFYLAHAGLDYEVAENGRLAVDAALAADAAGRSFDVVLMDMQMPEMDGYAATAALRAAGLDVPVLALTAHGTEAQRRQSFAAGCCEHLVKPVDHADLIGAIATHTARANSLTATVPIASIFSDDPGFASALNDYIAELPEQVARLISLMSEAGVSPDLRRLVHQIKGAGGGYGLPALSDAAEDAETAIDAGDVNRATQSVDTLVGVMRAVRGYDVRRESADATARSSD